jgi:hypothetical protein
MKNKRRAVKYADERDLTVAAATMTSATPMSDSTAMETANAAMETANTPTETTKAAAEAAPAPAIATPTPTPIGSWPSIIVRIVGVTIVTVIRIGWIRRRNIRIRITIDHRRWRLGHHHALTGRRLSISASGRRLAVSTGRRLTISTGRRLTITATLIGCHSLLQL